MSAAASLDYILTLNSDSNSKFYGKIDVDNIGIGGHSQGGLGTINAVTAQDNGNRYKVMYAASAPTLQISVELQEKYNNISDGVPKIIARRKDTDHGEMPPYADGYMTAWFMWWLKGDTEARSAFFGENAEILTNDIWQDVEKNI